jgi:hypothetical protein
VHRLPIERPVIRFADFAAWFDAHAIERHKGREREREILTRLVRDFGRKLLHTIDREMVIEWRTRRLSASTTIPAFGSRGHVPKWLLVHRYLREHGPTALLQLAPLFRQTSREIVRTFLKPATAPYFAKVRRGVWTAIGEPVVADRVIPPPIASTVNREVDLLQQIMAAAVPKYLAASPVAGLPNLRATAPIRRTMSADEEVRVLAHLSPVDHAIVLVGLLYAHAIERHPGPAAPRRSWRGARDSGPKERPSEHGADFEPPTRGARRPSRSTPENPSGRFPTRRGPTEAARRKTIAGALQRACRKAGVPYGRARGGLTFHWSTRRTGATRIIRAGGDGAIALAQKIGNWKDPSVLIDIY